MSEYGYAVDVAEGYDEAVVRARLALRGEGFSILSEMHVGGVLGPEAGDQRQYLFMGLWNVAFSQIEFDPGLKAAAHLPCNVVVQESGRGAIVAALDPVEAVEGEETVPPEIAVAARDALGRALARIGAPQG